MAAEAKQVGRDPDHIGDGGERHVAEFLEPDAAGGFAEPHEPLVALDIGRGEPGDFLSHGVGVAGALEA